MNVKLTFAISLVLLLGFAMSPSQAQVQLAQTGTPVAQQIQPGWTFTIEHTNVFDAFDNSHAYFLNDSNSQFLFMYDEHFENYNDGQGTSDILVVDVLQEGNDPVMEPAGIATLENQTGSFGYAYNETFTELYYDFDTQQNVTNTGTYFEPYQSDTYQDSGIEGFVPMNDTYLPMPEFFLGMLFPGDKPPEDNNTMPQVSLNQDDMNGTINDPINDPFMPIFAWLFSNLTIFRPYIEVFTETVPNVYINGNYFTIDATVVHFMVQSAYADVGAYYDDWLQDFVYYNISGNLEIDTYIYYDEIGMFFYAETLLNIDFQGEIYGAALGMYLIGDLDPSDPMNYWDIYYYAAFNHDESMFMTSELTQISGLYQGSSGSNTTTSTTDTNTSNSTDTNTSNSTDTNSTSPPELPLPGLTFTTSLFAFTALATIVILRKKNI